MLLLPYLFANGSGCSSLGTVLKNGRFNGRGYMFLAADFLFLGSLLINGGWAKWLTLSTLVIATISYMGYLVTPDWREIVDSKHYYSNWK
ncbi:unnamed protein product, partial [Strongylus vulgaris]